MEQSYSFLYRFRDLILSIGLACLLVLAFKNLVHIIAPKPQFFPLIHLRDKNTKNPLTKLIRDKKLQLEELSLSAEKPALPAENIQAQIQQLKLEISKLEAKSKDIHEAKTQDLQKAQLHHKKIASYIAIPIAIVLLITAFFALPLPIQIGSILGGLYIMLSSFASFWLSISEWLKLVSILIAIALIVTLIMKIYKKN